jgi:hypothetical protein
VRDGARLLKRSTTRLRAKRTRRGRAGRATEPGTIDPTSASATGEQGMFIRFRLGIWPDFYPDVQFSQDPAALDQWWRQQTLDTAPANNTLVTDPVAALFDKISPAILVSHSANGVLG